MLPAPAAARPPPSTYPLNRSVVSAGLRARRDAPDLRRVPRLDRVDAQGALQRGVRVGIAAEQESACLPLVRPDAVSSNAYTIRSERQLMEQLNYNLLFRWFVGLTPDDPVWVPTVFTKNRDRLLAGNIAEAFCHEVLRAADARQLLSHEHFTVDATLLEAWASQKSFRPKDDPSPPPSDGDPSNPTVNFRAGAEGGPRGAGGILGQRRVRVLASRLAPARMRGVLARCHGVTVNEVKGTMLNMASFAALRMTLALAHARARRTSSKSVMLSSVSNPTSRPVSSTTGRAGSPLDRRRSSAS